MKFCAAAVAGLLCSALAGVSLAEPSFHLDRYLRAYFWQSTNGRFAKLEPIRAESELPRTLGLVFYKAADGSWDEKPGCFPGLTPPDAEATSGSFDPQPFTVWDHGWWPPSPPPANVSFAGVQISISPSSSGETLRRLEIEIAIPDAVIYRKDPAEFRAIAADRHVPDECLEVLRNRESYVAYQVLVGRESFVYKRYTNQGVFPVTGVGPPGFASTATQGYYEREKRMLLAHRGLKPIWKKVQGQPRLVDFRPISLSHRKSF